MFRKELLSEVRTKSGILSAGLFSIVSTVAVALASYGKVLSPDLAAGLFWVILLFTATVSLPRAFIGEEEAGTADWLRLIARPHAVFWGKALFNLVQMLLSALLLSVLFFVLVSIPVQMPLLYLISLLGGCAALAGAVTFCGALVAQATNRSALVGAIGLPLLLPLVALGLGATSASLIGGTNSGWEYGAGLWLYSIALFAIGPHLFAAVWKG